MIYHEFTWVSFRHDTMRVNRRIANLLSAFRMYVDHVKHAVATLHASRADLPSVLNEMFSAQYKAHLGYRALEEIRNYAQHRDLPVDLLSYPAGWEPRDAPQSLVFRIVPAISVAKLREDPKIKQSIIAQLAAVGERVPLTPLARECVEALGAVHEQLRSLIEDDVQCWEGILHDIHARAEAQFGRVSPGLAIVARDEHGADVASEWIVDDLIPYRKELATKNTGLGRLSDRFVSGECPLQSL